MTAASSRPPLRTSHALDILRGTFSDEFVNRFQTLIHLMALMQTYAESTRSLLGRLQTAVDPLDVNDGEILLAITAARNVLRLVVKGRRELGQTGFLHDAFEESIRAFEAANGDLIQARNVIEHADEYIVGDGRSPDDWFDIARRYDQGVFIFVIGKRQINLADLATSTATLSSDSIALFNQWLRYESTFDYWRVLVKPLTERGLTARVSFNDFSDVSPFVTLDQPPRETFEHVVEIYGTHAEAELQKGTAITVIAAFDALEHGESLGPMSVDAKVLRHEGGCEPKLGVPI
jgi:hypothetical protein